MSTLPLFRIAAPTSSADIQTPSTKPDGELESGSTSDMPEWRRDEITEKYRDDGDYGDWKDDMADAVGISRWREL